MFLNQEKHVGRLRGVKILTNSKRRKEREGWGKRLPRNPYKKEVTTPNTAGPSPDPSPGGKGSDHRDTPMRKRPLPLPLPRREGRNHRDTPMANHQHLTTITQHPSLAVMICELCMPEAFCGLEIVRQKVLLNL